MYRSTISGFIYGTKLTTTRDVSPIKPFRMSYKSGYLNKDKVKNYGTMGKVLSKGIHMCNMEALSLLV